MNKVLENLIDRVAALPKEAHEEVVRSLVEIEQRHTGVYTLDDDERADILRGARGSEAWRSCVDDEAAALFKRSRGMKVRYSRRALRSWTGSQLHRQFNPRAAAEWSTHRGAVPDARRISGHGTLDRRTRRSDAAGRALSIRLLHAAAENAVRFSIRRSPQPARHANGRTLTIGGDRRWIRIVVRPWLEEAEAATVPISGHVCSGAEVARANAIVLDR